MMSKFSFVVFCLLAALLCCEAHRKLKQRVRRELRDHEERIQSLENEVFGHGPATNVTLKILNDVTPLPPYVISVNTHVFRSVFQMMKTAENEYPGMGPDSFWFQYTYFASVPGNFINSIRGLAGDANHYWSFRFEGAGDEVPFDRGVDYILVKSNDVIIFRYVVWIPGDHS